jgi:hypothetical protein
MQLSEVKSLLAWWKMSVEIAHSDTHNIDSKSLLSPVVYYSLYSRSSSRWASLTLRYLCLGYGEHKELLEAGIVDALHALTAIDDRQTGHISRNIVEVIRCVSSAKGCESALANENTITMLRGAAEMCKEEAKTMYSISVILYK